MLDYGFPSCLGPTLHIDQHGESYCETCNLIKVDPTLVSYQMEHPVFHPAHFFLRCSLHAVQVVLPVRVRRDGGHAGVGLPGRAVQLRRLHRLLHHDHGVHLPGKKHRRSSVMSVPLTLNRFSISDVL